MGIRMEVERNFEVGDRVIVGRTNDYLTLYNHYKIYVKSGSKGTVVSRQPFRESKPIYSVKMDDDRLVHYFLAKFVEAEEE